MTTKSEKKKSSIVVKFTRICITITVLTVLVLSTVFIINSRNVIQEQTIAGTMYNISALEAELLGHFAEWNSLVTLTATAAAHFITPYGIDEEVLLNLFVQNMRTQPDVFDVYLASSIPWFDPGGFAIFGGGWSPPAGWNNTERPWFLAATGNPGRVGYTEPYINLETGGLAISMARNVYDNQGRHLGVIAADVDFSLFNSMIEDKIFINGQRIFLINREGVFITHPDSTAVLNNNLFDEAWLAQYRQSILSSRSFHSIDRNNFILSEFIPEVDWILVTIIPTSAIFAETYAFIRNMIFIVLMLLAAALFVSIWFTRKELAAPIRSIMSAAGSIADMDFSVDIKVTENDELGDVQEAMVKIRDNLKKNLDVIQSTNIEAQRKMEEAVKERMHAILDSTPMLCIIYDDHGNPVEVNKVAESMLGVHDMSAVVSHWDECFHPRQPDGTDSHQKTVDEIGNALRDGFSRYEFMYKHRDGSPIPTEETMARVTIDGKECVMSFSRDLREFYASKEAEQSAQKRVSELTERLNRQLETQASAITESSAAIEEMIANIRSVSNTLSKNAENAKHLQEASGVGHAGLNEVASDIMEIARESESLLGINSVMENIASQTNLLSMNAAIEAAHAGDSGRGFAVVAGEIRKLAESSSQQSKTISAVLKNIKGSIDKITKSTGNVMEKFTAIDSVVKTVVQQEQGIMNAMTEQGAGSTQIMQAIAQVNDITHQVKADAQQMVEAAAKLGA
ncbi:MAG: methyl-accepting chemotaxis protein [Defluviitaleaceae bacterium]|nr:methyl-accepting chemotaxis protein [Defluviitaleaceae bacterium]